MIICRNTEQSITYWEIILWKGSGTLKGSQDRQAGIVTSVAVKDSYAGIYEQLRLAEHVGNIFLCAEPCGGVPQPVWMLNFWEDTDPHE